MTELTLTNEHWDEIHPDFKSQWGDGQITTVYNEETRTFELARVAVIEDANTEIAAAELAVTA